MTATRPGPILTTDDRGYWYIHWPESVPGYREGPYSDRALVRARIREQGYTDDAPPAYLLRELERVVDCGLATDGEAEAYLFRLDYVVELPNGRLTLTAAGIAARRNDR